MRLLRFRCICGEARRVNSANQSRHASARFHRTILHRSAASLGRPAILLNDIIKVLAAAHLHIFPLRILASQSAMRDGSGYDRPA
jgi:hypothetical protein